MKPLGSAQVAHVGSFDEEVTMGIDMNSLPFILQTMTNLYSDKILAFIREYSTNAMDSHIEAGQTRPIQVTTPSGASPTFVVEDFGMGLSRDDIVDTYSKFGASTKRNSNDMTGMLGLGCKSALTYALSFTVEGTKDNITTVAVVSKGDDGVGRIRILDQMNTGQPNGVRISIPVEPNDVSTVCDSASRFFSYWRGGVLVDGVVPRNITTNDGFIQIDDDIYVSKSTGGYDRDSTIVMGGVAYKTETPRNDNKLVAFVPMGSVEFVPSREALKDTQVTEETLADVFSYAKDKLEYSLRKQSESLTTAWQRFTFERDTRDLYGNNTHFGRSFTTTNMERNTGGNIWRVHHGGRTNQNSRFTLHMQNDNMKYVKGFPFKSVSNSHLERLRLAGFTETSFFVLPSTWNIDTSDMPGIHWDDVPALPKEARESAPRATKTVYSYRKGDKTHKTTDLGTVAPNRLVYQTNGNSSFPDVSLAELYSAWTFVALQTRQVDKLKRDLPYARDFWTWFVEEQEKVKPQVTQAMRDWVKWDHTSTEMFKFFHTHKDRITHAGVLALLVEPPSDTDLRIMEKAHQLKVLDQVYRPERSPVVAIIRKLVPLAFCNQSINSTEVEDVILYINTKGEQS